VNTPTLTTIVYLQPVDFDLKAAVASTSPVVEDPVENSPYVDNEIRRISLGSSYTQAEKNKKKSTWVFSFGESELEVESRADTVKKHFQYLRTDFCGQKYDEPLGDGETATGQSHARRMDFKPLLFHCKLYVFAQMYLIPALKRLTLRKLNTCLLKFDSSLETTKEYFAMRKTRGTSDGTKASSNCWQRLPYFPQ